MVVVVLAAILLRRFVEPFVDGPALQTWSTIFVSIILQALPFLVGGVVISGFIAALVPPERMAALLPRNRVASVAAAGTAGVLLPGCECGSVPITGRLVAAGTLPAAALAFMLAAPAINPVVLISTAVAFPGRPEMVLARFLASLAVAILMGLLWLRRDPGAIVERARRHSRHGSGRADTFALTVRHDFLQAGGFLVLGAGAAALIQTYGVPILDGGFPGAQIAAMALLAFLLSICSEADAFVAASFVDASPTAQLVFLVVGPAVDLKLFSMQAGVFGPSFATRFAPLTAVVAVAVAVLVGGWLL